MSNFIFIGMYKWLIISRWQIVCLHVNNRRLFYLDNYSECRVSANLKASTTP